MVKKSTAKKATKKTTYQKAPIIPAPRVVREWSSYQKDVFNDIASGEGNTHVEAKAGSGKTSTIIEGFYHVPAGKRSLMCAFNKSIQVELASRAPASIEISTLHSLGYKACRKAFPRIGAPDSEKLNGYVKAEMGDDYEGYEAREAVKKTVSLAKSSLASTPEEIDGIVDQYGIDVDGNREDFVARVIRVMESCKKDTTRIDFDDMIYFPNVHNLKLEKYGMVFIDEAQDLNPAQINLALNSVEENGRILTVADKNQSIYSFRCADVNAVDNIISRLNSKVLPLSVTYRCAKAIVELAQTLVPEIEAAPNAKDGLVEEISSRQVEGLVKPGDFIISRINAPLISWCLQLLKAKIPANIQGRDLGKSLLTMIKSSKAKDVNSFLNWLEKWKEMEVERLIAKKRNADMIYDKAECLEVLCEGTNSISDVKNNIDKLFHDGDDKDRVILSSTHKAKGLERDTVFLLKDTYRPNKGQEESNLYYVGITRAKSNLYLVRK